MKHRTETPPKIAEWLLYHFVNTNERAGVMGDFAELYADLNGESGLLRASVWYWWQVLRSIPHFIRNFIYWRLVMVKNSLKTAIRNMERYKIFSAINIIGLAIGMTCCILILLWVNDELNFDRFHKQADNLYRLVTEGHYTSTVNHFAYGPAPLAPALKDEFPEILNTCRFINAGRQLVRYHKNRFYEDNLYFADPSFLEMFTFPLKKGKMEPIFSDPYSILVTEEMAVKYFGSNEPIGQVLQIDQQFDLKVTGVLKNIPHNSHIQFDFLVPMELLIKLGGPTHWGGHFYRIYALLQPNTSYQKVNEMLPGWTKEHTPEPVRYYLQPLSTIHLYALDGGGPIIYVYIFSAIAIFVLLVACINYMNLATARSSTRALEVGIRKVIGANRLEIIKQFLGESLFLSIFALVLALVLTYFFLPVFNQISGKELSFDMARNFAILAAVIGIMLLTGLLGGSYPAFFLSAFQPANVLRRGLKSDARKPWLRRILVVIQFSLSIILIIGTGVLDQQLDFIQNKHLGFDKDHLIYLPMRGEIRQKYKVFKSDLLKNPQIVDVTAGSGMPGGPIESEWGQIFWEGKQDDEVIPMRHLAVAENYLNVFGMKIVQGRNFSREFSNDTLNFILTEAAIQATNQNNPIGRSFTLLFRTGKIIGVARDFHTGSLHSEIRPVIIRMVPARFWNFVFIKIAANPADLPEIIGFLEKKWQTYASEYPFEYEFLESTIDQLYRTEQRASKILTIFALLAIIVTCLGLLGLTSFMAEQRTKEIGIRKVLGSSVPEILMLLSKEFAILAIISNIIAWPLAYFIMKSFLQNYAYHISITPGVMVLSGILTCSIALITVSYQALKAALANPLAALKYE